MTTKAIQAEPDLPPMLARNSPLRSRKLLVFLGLLTVFFMLFARFAGSMLVKDRPERSDVIVVLAGDSQDERYHRGMALLRAGYGKHLFVDASSDSNYYGHTPAEYAAAFLQQDAKEMADRVSVCPFEEDSTVTETRYVARCIGPLHAASVLLVTSDWHTSRAHAIFARRLPHIHWSVAAALDDRLFGAHWWQHREWAKTTFQEWLKVVWWNGIDRWR
ncbi:MAG TPA: YdcF family protein [Candidatus Angelobacter sp.]|nr:YdcF family protein [Candidatus Angelobacter sp.]